jgi:hypothetical protein
MKCIYFLFSFSPNAGKMFDFVGARCYAEGISKKLKPKTKGTEMTIITKDWNGAEVAYSFDPYHTAGVVSYYSNLVANGTLQSYRVA